MNTDLADWDVPESEDDNIAGDDSTEGVSFLTYLLLILLTDH